MRPPDWLLWTGVLAGVALALTGVVELEPGAADVDDPAVAAVVDGVPIPSERFHAALAGLAAEPHGPRLDEAVRRQLLEELIAEELLLARARALGLDRTTPLARRHLVDAMVALAAADAEVVEPDEASERAWYDAHKDQFTRERLLHVQAWFYADTEDDGGRAADATAALRRGSEPPPSDPAPASPPDGAVPAATLRHYVGPTAARAAAELEVGQVSDPVRGWRGWRVVRLVAAPAAETASFETVRDSVRALMARERRAEAIASYLRALRADASVDVDPAMLDPEAPIPADALARARAPSSEGAR